MNKADSFHLCNFFVAFLCQGFKVFWGCWGLSKNICEHLLWACNLLCVVLFFFLRSTCFDHSQYLPFLLFSACIREHLWIFFLWIFFIQSLVDFLRGILILLAWLLKFSVAFQSSLTFPNFHPQCRPYVESSGLLSKNLESVPSKEMCSKA